MTAVWPYLLFVSTAVPVSLLVAGVAGHREDERVARASRREKQT